MKKCIYTILILLQLGMVGCTEETRLPNYNDIKLDISVQTGRNFIDLDGNLVCGERNLGEYGFVFTCTLLSDNNWENLSYQKKIVLQDGADFKTHIADNFGDPMECEAFAYANIDGRLYRSRTVDFKAGGDAPIEIHSIKIQPNADRITGSLIMEGKNFSSFPSRNILAADTLLAPGWCYFRLEEYSPEYLRFSYTCCSIGDIPLRLQVGAHEICLEQRLPIVGPILKGFSPKRPRAGERVEVLVDNLVEDATYAVYTEGISAGFQFSEGKLYAIFGHVPKEADLQMYYMDNRYNVYMAPEKIVFSCPWSKMHFNSSVPEIKALANGWAYAYKNKTLYCYSPETNKFETYKVTYPEGLKSAINADLYAKGDYVYVCNEVAAVPPAVSQETMALVLMRFHRRTHQWEFLSLFPGFVNPELTVCGDFLLIKDYNHFYDFDVLVYNTVDGTMKQVTDVLTKNLHWVGTYRDFFYYIDTEEMGNPVLKRVRVGEWKSIEVISQLPTGFYGASIQHAWIEGDYFYMDKPLVRLDLISSDAKPEVLGEPAGNSASIILPTPDNIYCIDYNGGVYRYVEDRPE